MRDARSFENIFLHKKFVDLRKNIGGLSQIIVDEMKHNPCDGALFVFLNKNKCLMKCVYWDKTGFALWQKRLEREKFRWPVKLGDDIIKVSVRQLEWLLAGLDIVKAKPHETLRFDDFT
jgi:transposase